ncbi:MAG: YcgN family cysteine cluster protein [Pseudomonadales bacterium]
MLLENSSAKKQRPEFWAKLPLAELNDEEWEALCDGCGQCCLIKLADDATGELHYTALACQLLDLESCRCSNYTQRLEKVPSCLDVRLLWQSSPRLAEMPASCAYRLRARELPLPQWHPLCSNDSESVGHAGVSVRGRVIPEEYVHEEEWQEHIITWVEL